MKPTLVFVAVVMLGCAQPTSESDKLSVMKGTWYDDESEVVYQGSGWVTYPLNYMTIKDGKDGDFFILNDPNQIPERQYDYYSCQFEISGSYLKVFMTGHTFLLTIMNNKPAGYSKTNPF